MHDFVVNAIDSFFLLVVFGLGVPGLCALVLNHIEQALFAVLTKRFGVTSVVYLTGWLGTPIHEFSHAALCLVFLHRIDEIQPFKPDFETGTLGYVKHTPRDNAWSKVGGFFIGVAPLFGGSLALCLLTWACTGVNWLDTGSALAGHVAIQSPGETLYAFFQIALQTLGDLGRMRHWALWPVFLYASVCIGAHMAPSGSDIKNGLPGLAMIVTCFALISLTVGALQALGARSVTMGQLFYFLNLATGPVVLLLMIAITLNLANLLVCWVVCMLFRRPASGPAPA